MNYQIPSAEQVAARLQPMSTKQLGRLADLTRVPFHTLLKIRDGDTKNPRIETVRMFWGQIDVALEAA